MKVKIQFSLRVDGDVQDYVYKIEDGKDEDMCKLVQEARIRLNRKMELLIDQECQ